MAGRTGKLMREKRSFRNNTRAKSRQIDLSGAKQMPPERTFRRRKGITCMKNYSTNGKAKTPSQRERVLSRLKQGSVTSWELTQMGILGYNTRI